MWEFIIESLVEREGIELKGLCFKDRATKAKKNGLIFPYQPSFLCETPVSDLSEG